MIVPYPPRIYYLGQKRDRGRTRTTARTDADERATPAHHGFPGFKTDFTDRLRARSRLHVPRARTIFRYEGPRKAPRAGPPLLCRTKEHRPGSLRAEAYVLRSRSVRSV